MISYLEREREREREREMTLKIPSKTSTTGSDVTNQITKHYYDGVQNTCLIKFNILINKKEKRRYS
jgi:hypothetical protein